MINAGVREYSLDLHAHTHREPFLPDPAGFKAGAGVNSDKISPKWYVS